MAILVMRQSRRALCSVITAPENSRCWLENNSILKRLDLVSRDTDGYGSLESVDGNDQGILTRPRPKYAFDAGQCPPQDSYPLAGLQKVVCFKSDIAVQNCAHGINLFIRDRSSLTAYSHETQHAVGVNNLAPLFIRQFGVHKHITRE